MLYFSAQKNRTHLPKYKLCEPVKVCCYWTLSSLRVIESLVGRVPIIKQTFDRIRLFQNERKIFWRFSCLTYNKSKTKNAKIYMLLLFARVRWAFKFSPLRLVSSFWLSRHLFLAVQFISEFIWINVRWNGPTWQAKTITSCFAINCNWKERTRNSTWSDTARANQSASQDCWLPTNQRLTSGHLRHGVKKQKNRAGFKTRPPAFGVTGYVRCPHRKSSCWGFLNIG